jgi:hypothetical protein
MAMCNKIADEGNAVLLLCINEDGTINFSDNCDNMVGESRILDCLDEDGLLYATAFLRSQQAISFFERLLLLKIGLSVK